MVEIWFVSLKKFWLNWIYLYTCNLVYKKTVILLAATITYIYELFSWQEASISKASGLYMRRLEKQI